MRSFNPACKFIALMAVTFILAYHHDPVVNALVFAAAVILMAASRVDIKVLAGLMIPVFILAFSMFFTGYRFSSLDSMPVSAEAFNIGSTAIWNGLIHGTRVLAYAGIGLLFALTTDKILMMRSAQRQFHLPQTFAYGILAAWGIFPSMAREYRRTKAAFRARGMRVMFASPKLLAPLLVKSIRWSEELSIAMKSKGFSERGERTAYEKAVIRPRDWALLAGCCVVFPITLALIL